MIVYGKEEKNVRLDSPKRKITRKKDGNIHELESIQSKKKGRKIKQNERQKKERENEKLSEMRELERQQFHHLIKCK